MIKELKGSLGIVSESNSQGHCKKQNKRPLNNPHPATCHYCEKVMGQPDDVQCTNPECALSFCQSCLIRYYRYSRKVAKRLPTPTWKCPKCTKKCLCPKYVLPLRIARCITETERKTLVAMAKNKKGLAFRRELEKLIESKEQALSCLNSLIPKPSSAGTRNHVLFRDY